MDSPRRFHAEKIPKKIQKLFFKQKIQKKNPKKNPNFFSKNLKKIMP
jgi:hypothetical protein